MKGCAPTAGHICCALIHFWRTLCHLLRTRPTFNAAIIDFAVWSSHIVPINQARGLYSPLGLFLAANRTAPQLLFYGEEQTKPRPNNEKSLDPKKKKKGKESQTLKSGPDYLPNNGLNMITVIFELPLSAMKSSIGQTPASLLKAGADARFLLGFSTQSLPKTTTVITADPVNGSGARPVHRRISVIIVSQML